MTFAIAFTFIRSKGKLKISPIAVAETILAIREKYDEFESKSKLYYYIYLYIYNIIKININLYFLYFKQYNKN